MIYAIVNIIASKSKTNIDIFITNTKIKDWQIIYEEEPAIVIGMDKKFWDSVSLKKLNRW